jgi:hypothetical protein
MPDLGTVDPFRTRSGRVRIPFGLLRRRWVLAATGAIVAVNILALVVLVNVGAAKVQGPCGGGGSGYSGFSGYSGPGCTADLSVRIFESQDPIAVGSRLFYLIQITNKGPDSAQLVEAEVSIPTNVKFDWAASAGGFCFGVLPGATTVRCTFADLILSSGSTVAVIVEMRPQEVGTVREMARASTDAADDPNTSNNAARAKTTVTG